MTTPPGTRSRWSRQVIGPFTLLHVVILVMVLLIAAGVLGLLAAPVQRPARQEALAARSSFLQFAPSTAGLTVGQVAPELEAVVDGQVVPLRDLEGDPISLEALRGHPVWLSFFATWCRPCQEETPVLRDAYAKYADKGLAMIAVSVQETTPADVAAYAETYSLRYPIGFDASGAVFQAYRGHGLPTHVFIDADGVIQDVRYQSLDRETAAGIIEPLLQGSAG